MDGAASELRPDSWRENVAAIVLEASGRVLLGLGTGHHAYWHFPQGGINSKESAVDALRRELREEAGLSPDDYRIIACYGGLRYRYRKGNEKSGRWRGQEQWYYLVHCHAELPEVDCSQTNEFCALTWVPWRELSPELFAPFKRGVVEKVLATFFPPQLTEAELMEHLQENLTPLRYRLAGRPLSACPTEERALYGGGKEEMTNTLARLAVQLRAAQKSMAARRGRLLILLHGGEGSGRKQALRRLAAALDPLLLRAAQASVFTRELPWELLLQLPPVGGVTIALQHESCEPDPQDWMQREVWLMGQGIQVLKLYLHTDAAGGDDRFLAASDSAASPWYIIPAERRWYRDYLMASLVISAMSERI